LQASFSSKVAHLNVNDDYSLSRCRNFDLARDWRRKVAQSYPVREELKEAMELVAPRVKQAF
jgi:hypothetical protein